jgi:tripartite-type tricarboxylate transporter receptor subunit TctC
MENCSTQDAHFYFYKKPRSRTEGLAAIPRIVDPVAWMTDRRSAVRLLIAAVAAVFCSSKTFADSADYPTRAIHMIVPFAPGGGADVMARMVSEKIRTQHNVVVVVDNRSGANGVVGGTEVRRAPADGYNLLFSASTHILARQVMLNAPYDPLADFTPIALVGSAPQVLVMSPRRPQVTIADILADARQNPTRWTIGIASLGSASHLAAIAFVQSAGIDIPIVAYRGTAPAINDVVGDHIALMFGPISVLLSLIRGGKLKAIAVTSETSDMRSPLAPDIPTAAESGLSGLNVSNWYGLWGPIGLPKEIVLTLNAWVADAIRALAAEGRLKALGIEPNTKNPEEFAHFLTDEFDRNTGLLRTANIKPQ